MSQTFGPPGTSVNLRLLEFVQSQPPERPASEVVELAKEAGFELELMQVYKYRELARAKEARATVNESKEPTMTTEEETSDTAASEEPKPGRGRPGRRPGGEDTRAGWVRSLPLDMPVKEVVEKALEKGWELSEGYVYAIRSKLKAPKKPTKKAVEKAPVRGTSNQGKAKGKGRKKAEVAAPKAPEKPKRGRPGRKKAEEKSAEAAHEGTLFRKPLDADVRKVEEEFAKLALEIGLLRSGQLLEELKGRLAELVRPRGRG